MKFRVETKVDHESGLIYAEIYYPEDSEEPIVTSNPIYKSHEEAEKDIFDVFVKNIKGG